MFARFAERLIHKVHTAAGQVVWPDSLLKYKYKYKMTVCNYNQCMILHLFAAKGLQKKDLEWRELKLNLASSSF